VAKLKPISQGLCRITCSSGKNKRTKKWRVLHTRVLLLQWRWKGNNAKGGPRAQRDNCNEEIRSIIDGGGAPQFTVAREVQILELWWCIDSRVCPITPSYGAPWPHPHFQPPWMQIAFLVRELKVISIAILSLPLAAVVSEFYMKVARFIWHYVRFNFPKLVQWEKIKC